MAKHAFLSASASHRWINCPPSAKLCEGIKDESSPYAQEGSLIADDLKGILHNIREQHRPDTMTADEVSFAENMQNQLREAMNFEGSSEEKQIRSFLATFGIDYDKLTKEQFVTLIDILKLSKHLKTPISQRGKTTMTHGKGKRKKR